MTITARQIGVALVVTLTAALTLVVLPSVGSADPRAISVFEPTGQGVAHWYDLGDVDDGPGADDGDLLLEHRPLTDPGTDEPAGTAVTRVQVVDVDGGDPTFIIDCTIRLADGDLAFYGAGAFNDLGNGVTFAVTGGTGAYDRAAGTVTVTVVEGGAAIDFELARR